MCRYCKGTGKYRLLDRFVDCDQCDAAVKGCSESDKISTPAPGVVFNPPDGWLTYGGAVTRVERVSAARPALSSTLDSRPAPTYYSVRTDPWSVTGPGTVRCPPRPPGARTVDEWIRFYWGAGYPV